MLLQKYMIFQNQKRVYAPIAMKRRESCRGRNSWLLMEHCLIDSVGIGGHLIVFEGSFVIKGRKISFMECLKPLRSADVITLNYVSIN